MLLLPTFNARLQPCPVSAAAFTPHPQGHFCSQCQRVVQDFSHSTNPVADLAAARAASPDGRVCGSFAAAQTRRPRLTQRLRWFVVALVLVVGQGLTAREALAQVRREVDRPSLSLPMPSRSERIETPALVRGDTVLVDDHPNIIYGAVSGQMPSLHGGGMRELAQYIQRQVVWPHQNGKLVLAEGKVVASFKVAATGRVREVRIVKGLHPLLDAEVLRVIRALPTLTPGRQNGQPVEVDFIVPVNFKLE
jgi:TonB family protein